ncbi:hypothetical protein Aple_018020 [Acrocarpospora pleiomorpha]|uniref:Uncharacterized protein n=1 Tax=Acrocarpospora pleiomorpha TaxID=90975 RepID=A0A5M3XB47_9ACTN|nr:hypothetical protein [Acrocarpospora pleiomorpha]GES18907.1 hypothetical protein Aple_018020 [Acrocarpospora pleiomorpha]
MKYSSRVLSEVAASRILSKQASSLRVSRILDQPAEGLRRLAKPDETDAEIAEFFERGGIDGPDADLKQWRHPAALEAGLPEPVASRLATFQTRESVS